MILKLGMKHQDEKLYKVYINHGEIAVHSTCYMFCCQGQGHIGRKLVRPHNMNDIYSITYKYILEYIQFTYMYCTFTYVQCTQKYKFIITNQYKSKSIEKKGNGWLS